MKNCLIRGKKSVWKELILQILSSKPKPMPQKLKQKNLKRNLKTIAAKLWTIMNKTYKITDNNEKPLSARGCSLLFWGILSFVKYNIYFLATFYILSTLL